MQNKMRVDLNITLQCAFCTHTGIVTIENATMGYIDAVRGGIRGVIAHHASYSGWCIAIDNSICCSEDCVAGRNRKLIAESPEFYLDNPRENE